MKSTWHHRRGEMILRGTRNVEPPVTHFVNNRHCSMDFEIKCFRSPILTTKPRWWNSPHKEKALNFDAVKFDALIIKTRVSMNFYNNFDAIRVTGSPELQNNLDAVRDTVHERVNVLYCKYYFV